MDRNEDIGLFIDIVNGQRKKNDTEMMDLIDNLLNSDKIKEESYVPFYIKFNSGIKMVRVNINNN